MHMVEIKEMLLRVESGYSIRSIFKSLKSAWESHKKLYK